MVRNVATMPLTERLREVLTRAKKNLGPEVGAAIDALLSPTNLAILAGTLTLWVGSHLFGVGEVVDVLLLVAGAFVIGWSIGDVMKDLYTFTERTVNARSEADLDAAAKALSHAIVLAGITVVMALLLRRTAKQVETARGPSVIAAMRPREPGLVEVGPDPHAGQIWSRPGITMDPTLPPGAGTTSPFGEVRLSPHGTADEQALARFHEMVHRFLTPRFGILRTFRVRLAMSGYLRSALLQYLEEAMAETYAQLRVFGFSGLLTGVRFPVVNGYVTISELATEGVAIGTITAGNHLFTVRFLPAAPDRRVVDKTYEIAH